MTTETKHGHEHHAGATGFASVPWSVAASATLHCLTGCAIGEVLGMVIGTAVGLRHAATVVLSIVLAFVFGYALTMRGVLRAGVGFAERAEDRAGRGHGVDRRDGDRRQRDRAQRSRRHGRRSGELAVLGARWRSPWLWRSWSPCR